MDTLEITSVDQAIAVSAFAEVERLLTEAHHTYLEGDYRRSASALAALAVVVGPLDEHVQATWVDEVIARVGALTAGGPEHVEEVRPTGVGLYL